jgi:crossover junction endodeoxyribonuclease RuvC
MTILGIDPGSTRVGYGLIETRGGTLLHKESGLLVIPGNTKAERLVGLGESLGALLTRTAPARVGIERLFMAKNKKTAIEVAQARGVIVETVTRHKIPIIEVSPGEVKCAVTGDGGALKAGVASMVARLLALPKERRLDDVTDALAVAIAVIGVRDESTGGL